jgi:hypothetical protein
VPDLSYSRTTGCFKGDLVMTKASPCFDPYRILYPAREADLSRQTHPDETDDLSTDPAVFSLPVAPLGEAIQYTTSATEMSEPDDAEWLTSHSINKYLWLVRPDDVKVASEDGPLGKSTGRGRLAHTNLCGNTPAHCGGELWFHDERSVYINGASSRFMPRGKDELEEVVQALVTAGYRVCSFGWNPDHGVGSPKRVIRKADVVWRGGDDGE